MHKISIVIITKNAERKLTDVLQQAQKLSNDIIIVDSGSDDKTEEISKTFGVLFKEKVWQGYGKQKNYGNSLAKNSWILSLDADEVLSDALIEEIRSLKLMDNNAVYNIPFLNYYCGKIIKYGRWKNEHHVRLFNKEKVQWDTNSVHEGLIYDESNVKKLQHPVYHYSMESKAAHIAKAKKYAVLGAKKMHEKDKKATLMKKYVNPVFRFINDYFFRLGFLDGALGIQIASIISKETYWKYKTLHELNQDKKLTIKID